MSELLKSRHAFGSLENVNSAIDRGLIDAYDILFLDGDTEPKIGWLDKNGALKLVEEKAQVIFVDELPVADGDENVIYIYHGEGYIWDGAQCTSISKPANLTELEEQVAQMEAQMQNKVDADAVQDMIREYSDGSSEVVEF